MNAQDVELGLTQMPPLDIAAEEPCGVTNDVHFASLMVAILLRMMLLVLMDPVCCWLSEANDFNMKNSEAHAADKRGQTEQKHMVAIACAVIHDVWV